MSRTLAAFSLIELLCVVALLSLLAAILLPAFLIVREEGRSSVCLANERQIGQALLLYAQEYDGMLPCYAQRIDGTGAWWEVLPPYCHSRDLFQCPDVAAAASWGMDYGVNFQHVIQYPPGLPWSTPSTSGPAALDSFARPAETLVLADGTVGALYCPGEGVSNAPDWGFAFRHRGGANCLFVDGHARWHRPTALLDGDLWGHVSGG